jgi:hypothetical protein
MPAVATTTTCVVMTTCTTSTTLPFKSTRASIPLGEPRLCKIIVAIDAPTELSQLAFEMDYPNSDVSFRIGEDGGGGRRCFVPHSAGRSMRAVVAEGDPGTLSVELFPERAQSAVVNEVRCRAEIAGAATAEDFSVHVRQALDSELQPLERLPGMQVSELRCRRGPKAPRSVPRHWCIVRRVCGR